jgi:hypothetical protein
MLSSLIVLGAMLGPASRMATQNPQFPKPDLNTPSALQESSIFKYLSTEDKKKQWKPLEVGRDWSDLQVPVIKTDAIKLKVLLAVAERDFSNPEYSNTLEMRDKTRLLEAMGRLKSLFAVLSNGEINLEVTPRFISEPIFDLHEFKSLIDAEFNKSKFDSDDSIERGPFAAIIALSSSHVDDNAEPGEDYSVHGFSDLGGSSSDMWFEEALVYVVQSGIFNRMAGHFNGFRTGYSTQETSTLLVDRLSTFRGEYQRFFDPMFRQDGDLVSKWCQLSLREPGRPVKLPEMAAIQSPASLSVTDGVLDYSELSILRAGEFALPASDNWSTQKSLKFDFRTKGRNPMAVKIWKKDGSKQEYVLGNEAGMIPITSDYNWQTISIPLPGSDAIGATVGVPTTYFGKTRIRAELLQCEFRNFELTADAAAETTKNPAAPAYDSEAAIRDALINGTRFTKRRALKNIDLIKGMKGLEPALLAATSDLDAGVAHDAGRAYFELVLNGQPTPEEISTMAKFLSAPPNESIRCLALQYTAKNAAYASFDSVIGCTVRESWQVRRSAMVALASLARAGVKEKEGCHQTILTATGQELALIRLAAIEQLNPSVKLDSQRLEYLMVNDPCESVRLACLKLLAANNSIPKEKLLGSLADDSPSLRERIPVTLGAKNPILREALQKLVVDQDPYVRLSAIQNFAILGDVKDGEIQNAYTDKHPAVQIAILQGAAKGAWKIPADALARLKESPIPVVRNLAAEIK